MTEREQFEAWVYHRSHIRYDEMLTAWAAWQARAALAQLLPPVPAEPATTQPPYPEGVVAGPCVCGSWPGGECLRCKWIPSPSAEAKLEGGA